MISADIFTIITMWYVYILKCRNNYLYTGITNDLKRRLDEHRQGKGGRFTRSFGARKLVYHEGCATRSDALTREAQIKSLTRQKKLALVMKKITPVTLLMCLLVLSPLCYAYERVNPRGPMAIKNQMPLYLFWYAFPQEKAAVVAPQRLEAALDYTVSNVIIDKVTTPTEEYIVQADMEVNRYNLNVRYGIIEKLEASAEIPYLVVSKGYLDDFIPGFERAIGATAVGARQRAEKYQFKYVVQHNYRDVMRLQEPPAGLGDIAVAAKYMLIDEMQGLPRVSVRGALKFPTASKGTYLGTGKFDGGLGLLLDKSFGRLFFYGNANAVFINKPSFLDEFTMKGYIISGMLGLEYCFTERFSGALQGTLSSTPYPKTGTDPLDNPAGECALGLNYQFTVNSNWHIAVVENMFADSSPDVTFQAGGRIKF